MIGGDGINDESNKTAPPPTVQINLTKYTLIPKRQDILSAKSTRPRGSRLHEYRDLAGELKQTMRQLKDKEELSLIHI